MKKRVYGKLFIMMLTLCMALMTFAAAGISASADTGDTDEYCFISLHINQEYSAGIEIRLCKVGEYVNGTYVLDEKYADCGVDMTNLSEASASQAAAEKLAEVASKTDDGDTDIFIDSGYAGFTVSSMSSNVYVAFQYSDFDKIKITPALVVIPYTDESGEKVRDIDIEMKYEVIPVRGAVILNKYDLDKKVLKGAVFDLEKLTEYDGGHLYSLPYVKAVTGLVTDKNGQIVVKDLPVGIYRFVEVKAPEGYKLSSEAEEFEIKSSGTVKISGGIYVADEGDVKIYNVFNEPIEENSEPESSTEVSKPNPSTPVIVTGEDIAKFIIVGVVVGVSLVAVVLLVVLGRKKKNDDDDDE